MFEQVDSSHVFSSRRSTVYARQMVSTSQPLAAQAGLEILQEGGNAVDAAVATAICLTVVEPTMNSIGGDAFAIVSNDAGVSGFNGCGRSPAGWSPDYFSGNDEMPENGWNSVTVPGAVDTWVQLWEKFGSLSFDRLFKRAIEYAQDGYHISPILAQDWDRSFNAFAHHEGFSETFAIDGRAPQLGEKFSCPQMAESLREIAATKGDSFYRGRLAQKIAADSKKHGGLMTVDDLANHRGFWTDCIQNDYGDFTIHEIPPSGQGIVTLIAAGILKYLSIHRYEMLSADSIHLQIEAIKAGFFVAHQNVSDPKTMQISSDEILNDQVLQKCAEEISIDEARTPNIQFHRDKGTVYLATADASGMMVSMIQSHYDNFGSGMVVPGTGISMHNRGAGFVLEDGHPNQVAGNKQPFHTIIPAFATQNGNPVMAFGVMGAHHQPQGQIQLLNAIIHHGCSPQQSLDAPRWHVHEDFAVTLESGLAHLEAELSRRGHHIRPHEKAGLFGGGQVVMRCGDGYAGGSDPRKDGQTVGF